MWATVAIVGLVVIGAIVGTTLNFAAPFVAIPLVLLVLVGYLALRAVGRARTRPGEGSERNRLGAERLEFTERDERTLL